MGNIRVIKGNYKFALYARLWTLVNCTLIVVSLDFAFIQSYVLYKTEQWDKGSYICFGR